MDEWLQILFFVCHVHALVYTTILGFNGIKHYVSNFPSYAASIKVKCSNLRLRFRIDGGVNIHDGVALYANVINIVGLFTPQFFMLFNAVQSITK